MTDTVAPESPVLRPPSDNISNMSRRIAQPANGNGPNHMLETDWNAEEDQLIDDDELEEFDFNDAEGVTTKERWAHDALPSRKREREALGDPEPQDRCFGCIYDWNSKKAAMRNEHLAEMRAIARKGIAKGCPISVAHEMARHHEKLRREINATRGDRDPIPPWTPASILHHLRYHNVDPELQKALFLYQTQEAISQTVDSLIEVSDKTGERRPNEKQVSVYERLIKLWFFVSRQDAKKLSFYNPGEHIDNNVASQSIVTSEHKDILRFYKKHKQHH